MIYLLVAILLAVVILTMVVLLGLFELRKETLHLQELINDLPVLTIPAFKCNVPPVDDKDKPFVQTAPPWGDAPAPPEEG